MKRIVSLVIAVSMIFSMFATVFAAATYSDLTGENAKFAGAVAALSELRVDDQPVINGYPDGTFGPEKEVTRAELAKMLVVCLGLGSEVEALATKTVFSDVPTSYWAAGWINAAAQSKVIIGYPDGEFKPEKTVTYAEAFTMALRALGYGNVADFEGTWPTAYMLKAVELDLTRDMDGVKADSASLRGNIAILLWNMLRTPMWRVTEESESNGMTLSNANKQRMLNVKFPDYTYVEDVYVVDHNVTDAEDVTISLEDINEKTGEFVGIGEAQIVNVDLSRLVNGMKVTALVKEGKKGEDDTYLTLTPQGTLVEGVITEVKDDTFTVDGTEYRLKGGDLPSGDVEIAVNNYVVFEADGKKVSVHDGTFVIRQLPVGGKELKTDKEAANKFDEDDLIIKNGEWVSNEDLVAGDVWTEIEGYGNSYYMVTDERLNGDFYSYTKTTKKGVAENFVKLDEGDTELRDLPDCKLEAWEDEKNNKKVNLDEVANAKKADNKYLDVEVEVVLDYLGNPVKLLFGEVADLNAAGNFYVVTSNGVWSSSEKGGKVYHVELFGADDSEAQDYDFTRNPSLPTDGCLGEFDAGEETYYDGETPLFVWANFDGDDEELLKALFVLSGEGLVKGDKPNGDKQEYKGKYTVIPISGDVEDNLIADEYRINSKTVVMTAKAVKDEDDEDVIGYEVEVATGTDALSKKKIPEGSFLAYDPAKTFKSAAYVFIADDPESTDLQYGKLEEFDKELERGKQHVVIDGERYEISDKTDEEIIADLEEDQIVSYTESNGKVKIKGFLAISDLEDGNPSIVSGDTDPDEGIVFMDSNFSAEGYNGPILDFKKEEDMIDDLEDYNVVIVSVKVDKQKKYSIDSVEYEGEDGEALKGIDTLARLVSEYDRVLVVSEEDNKVFYVFTSFAENEEIVDGHQVFTDAETATTVTPTTNETNGGSGESGSRS